jgi:hypothetical protein
MRFFFGARRGRRFRLPGGRFPRENSLCSPGRRSVPDYDGSGGKGKL